MPRPESGAVRGSGRDLVQGAVRGGCSPPALAATPRRGRNSEWNPLEAAALAAAHRVPLRHGYAATEAATHPQSAASMLPGREPSWAWLPRLRLSAPAPRKIVGYAPRRPGGAVLEITARHAAPRATRPTPGQVVGRPTGPDRAVPGSERCQAITEIEPPTWR